jgi:hypothetical protein
VYLVRKRGGLDDGVLYAMKVIEKSFVSKYEKGPDLTMTERHVFEKAGDFPFLVGLHFAFQTELRLYLIVGEYIKTICTYIYCYLLNRF